MGARLTYRAYERRRLGNRSTPWARIAYMTRRAFGAASFAGFWRYWNPLFSYYLYYRCYRPLVRFLPRALAVVLTFAASGAVHDVFASLAKMRIFVLFTPVFAIFGLVVVAEETLGWSFSRLPVAARACLHAGLIAGTFAAGLFIRAQWL